MSDPVFLLGGFSTGPAISGAGITGDFPNNFALAGAAGRSYQFNNVFLPFLILGLFHWERGS